MRQLIYNGARLWYGGNLLGINDKVGYLNVDPSGLTFTYLSGSTDTFVISSNVTGYTITPSDSWIGVNKSTANYTTTVTVTMLEENSGLTDMVGTITVYSADYSLTTIVTVTQNFLVYPTLIILTAGGVFDGLLT